MSTMMRYKSFDYPCGCCSTWGKGHDRAVDRRQAQQEIQDMIDSASEEEEPVVTVA